MVGLFGFCFSRKVVLKTCATKRNYQLTNFFTMLVWRSIPAKLSSASAQLSLCGRFRKIGTITVLSLFFCFYAHLLDHCRDNQCAHESVRFERYTLITL